MPGTPRYFRRPLIALVAIFAASFAASDAAACSTMKQGQGACQTICGCCTSVGDEAPATRVEVANPILPQSPGVGCPAPAENCSCRSQEPAAPSPKPARSTVESRSELSETSAFMQLGEAFTARHAHCPLVPANQSPPKTPLYLRNARLLF